MTEPMTEPGKWLVAEYARTPGDPKWYPGLGLESTVIAIEAEARAEAEMEYADCWQEGDRLRARLALTEAVMVTAGTFLHHVTEAACWPTPGIGCDGKCKEADALRAAVLAAIEGSTE
jgi:hypothetical protein